MATVECPKCGQTLSTTGLAPGTLITCACGNVTTAPSRLNRTWLVLALGLLACPCIGSVAAIAIPNFVRFGQRAKAAECKSNLKAWHTAQRYHFQDHRAYEPVFAKVGFAPERSNRYAYSVGQGPMEVRGTERSESPEGAVSIGVDTFRFTESRAIDLEALPAPVKKRLGLSGTCPDCNITMVCAGNTDNDETLDVWVISTGPLDLQAEDGEAAEPGEPLHFVDDTRS
ncbi:fimbrial protein [Pyxidicoccus sp. MSG2]|uniref:fimbrial protein n=1 Tax=Pyxidicoccus sp. MSG2 TaxID=2996790 RepID=UPI00227200F2|nr:fimbrial protein [Pyxidicoccus sp. MSG2]MCY1020819.1 fimbrial protein [Pyxidicoccus sp. MSG2]